MENILKKVQSDLDKKEKLILEAKSLEDMANILRENAKNNDLKFEISCIQNEIVHLLEKYELLDKLVSLAIKLFGGDIEPTPISLRDYQNCSFNGKSISLIEQELISITSRIVFLCDILSNICSYVGHDYKFIKTDNVFDFNSLEVCLEERHIYGCAICGDVLCLEDKNELADNGNNELFDNLRKARRITVYQSQFKVSDTLDVDFGDMRR